MDRFKFAVRFVEILELAHAYGIRNAPIRNPKQLEKGGRERKRFLAACHRGYEKAQREVADEIIRLANGDNCSDAVFREAVLRKVMDSIAYLLLGTADHRFRRLSFLNKPPKVSGSVIRDALSESERFNKESRQTFALIADLTTSIHIADLLRIDMRNPQTKVTLIELKSGRVNDLLLDKLDEFEPTFEDLERLSKEKPVDERYMDQAKRIMRQRIRMAQTNQVLATDHGTDITTGRPITLSKDTYVIDTYDEVVDNLCTRALKGESGSATVNKCLHIGCAYDQNDSLAAALASDAAEQAMEQFWDKASDKDRRIRDDVEAQLGKDNRMTIYDPFRLNALLVATRPFPHWRMKIAHMQELVNGSLALRVVFDLPGFFCLGQSIGVNMRLSGKRAAGRVSNTYGQGYAVEWGGRMLEYESAVGWSQMFYGLLMRFVVGLSYPASVMKIYLNADDNFNQALGLR